MAELQLFLARYAISTDLPLLLKACDARGWTSPADLLDRDTFSEAGLRTLGVSTPMATQKLLHELGKLERAGGPRRAHGAEDAAACTLQRLCRTWRARSAFSQLQALVGEAAARPPVTPPRAAHAAASPVAPTPVAAARPGATPVAAARGVAVLPPLLSRQLARAPPAGASAQRTAPQQRQQDEQEELAVAATAIQANWRGHQGRAEAIDAMAAEVERIEHLQQLHGAQLELAELEADLQHTAAVAIQARFRGNSARQAFDEYLDDCVSSNSSGSLSPLRAAPAERIEMEAAASAIQAVWRGALARIHFDAALMATLTHADATLWEHVREEVTPRSDRQEEDDRAWEGQPVERETPLSRRQPQPLATPNRGSKAAVMPAASVADMEEEDVVLQPMISDEEAAVLIQSRLRGNADRIAVSALLLDATDWVESFFDAVVDGDVGALGTAELTLVNQAFGDSVHQAGERCSVILLQASPSPASAAGMVDRESFVSYWLDATRDLQSSDGCYSVGHVLELRAQLSVVEERLFEAGRFVDAPVYRLPGEEEDSAAAILIQSAARGRAGRKEMLCKEQERDEAAEVLCVATAEAAAVKEVARAQRLTVSAARHEHNAAVIVQAHHRGHMERTEAAAVKEAARSDRLTASAARHEHNAAVVVQAHHRGHVERKAAHEAAEGREVARVEARSARLVAAEDRRREAAATMVQAHHRGHSDRKEMAEARQYQMRQQKAEEELASAEEAVFVEAQRSSAPPLAPLPPLVVSTAAADSVPQASLDLAGIKQGALIRDIQKLGGSWRVGFEEPATNSHSAMLTEVQKARGTPGGQELQASLRRQPQPLATPNRGSKAAVMPAASVADMEEEDVVLQPMISDEEAAVLIQSRLRGNADRIAVSALLLDATDWVESFFDAVVDGDVGALGTAELTLVNQAFGDSVHQAGERCSVILLQASPSPASAAGMVDRESFVSYWLDATRDLQSSDGCYSVGHVLELRAQLSVVEERLFEAGRFVDAPVYRLPGEEEDSAAAILIQSAARGRAGRKEMLCKEQERDEAAEVLCVATAEAAAVKEVARAQRLTVSAARHEHNAAVIVQAHHRGHMERTEAAAVKEAARSDRLTASAARHEHNAAVVVQAHHRGHVERKAAHEAAEGREVARVEARSARLVAAEDRRREAAATMVQAHHRGHSDRKEMAEARQYQMRQQKAEEELASAEEAVFVEAQRSSAPPLEPESVEGEPPEVSLSPEASALDFSGADSAELLEQRKRAIGTALIAESEGDRRRALLAYFSVVKLSLQLLTDTELSERAQMALSLSAKAMTARAIRLSQLPRGSIGNDSSDAVASLGRKAMAADAAEDVVAALSLYRTAVALALEETEA